MNELIHVRATSIINRKTKKSGCFSGTEQCDVVEG